MYIHTYIHGRVGMYVLLDTQLVVCFAFLSFLSFSFFFSFLFFYFFLFFFFFLLCFSRGISSGLPGG